MLKKNYFDRSTLPQGPVKMYTREQMERLQVRPRDTKPYDPPVATIRMPPDRVAIPRGDSEVVAPDIVEESLLLASNGEHSVQEAATASGVDEGD